MATVGGALAIVVVLASCGRIAFDPRTDGTGDGGDIDGDGSQSDAGLMDAATGDAAPLVSCMGVANNCGLLATASCCASVAVPGGDFLRGYDVAGDGMYISVSSPATISSFRLDIYEVSVSRYRQFVAFGTGTQANPPANGAGARTLNGMTNQAGWDPAWNTNLPIDAAAQLTALACDPDTTWTNSPGANEALPINCVSWYDAMAFCIWDGGFMPSEAEWHYAASGGNEQRAYPWSSPAQSLTIDCMHANYFVSPNFCTNPATGNARRVGLGLDGMGRWGHADLAGNVWEWALDIDTGSYPMPCTDCAQLTGAGQRASQGGYYRNALDNLRAANRSSNTAANRVEYMGIRCARPL